MLLNLILVSRGGDPAVFSVLKGSFISPFFVGITTKIEMRVK